MGLLVHECLTKIYCHKLSKNGCSRISDQHVHDFCLEAVSKRAKIWECAMSTHSYWRWDFAHEISKFFFRRLFLLRKRLTQKSFPDQTFMTKITRDTPTLTTLIQTRSLIVAAF